MRSARADNAGSPLGGFASGALSASAPGAKPPSGDLACPKIGEQSEVPPPRPFSFAIDERMARVEACGEHRHARESRIPLTQVNHPSFSTSGTDINPPQTIIITNVLVMK